MDTLRLVEVAGDGALVLMTGDGRRFSLAVDEQVRSAVRRSRNGTHEAPVDERPGPREVQARIRAGADAEQVATQTGLDVDYVRRFEGPVLAERAHVADLARASTVDRGGDPTLSLERVVLDVLTGEGSDVDDISWDSRKVDGTRWQVVVTSRAGTARTEATWGFDTATRSLEPVGEEAERLTGVERRRRLSAVRETVFDVERGATPAARGGTVELLDALARQRGRRPAPREADAGTGADGSTGADTDPGVEGSTEADRDPGAEGVSEGAVTSEGHEGHEGHEEPGGHDDTAAQDDPDDDSPPGLRVVAAGRVGPGRALDEVSIEPDLLTDLELDQRPAARGTAPGAAAAPVPDRKAKRRRSAVPSWDEIVFGAKREDG